MLPFIGDNVLNVLELTTVREDCLPTLFVLTHLCSYSQPLIEPSRKHATLIVAMVTSGCYIWLVERQLISYWWGHIFAKKGLFHVL